MLPGWIEGSPLRMRSIPRTLAFVALPFATLAGDAVAQSATDKDKISAPAT